jgi:hypothetical protein
MTKLTHKEHVARAMLMGREYDWRDGTYMVNGAGDHLIDANTLESVEFETAANRCVIGNNYHEVGLDDRIEYFKWEGRLPWEKDE